MVNRQTLLFLSLCNFITMQVTKPRTSRFRIRFGSASASTSYMTGLRQNHALIAAEFSSPHV